MTNPWQVEPALGVGLEPGLGRRPLLPPLTWQGRRGLLLGPPAERSAPQVTPAKEGAAARMVAVVLMAGLEVQARVQARARARARALDLDLDLEVVQGMNLRQWAMAPW